MKCGIACDNVALDGIEEAFAHCLASCSCLETRARVKRTVVDGVSRFVALVDANGEPPADDSDAEVMDIGQT